jgi:MFS family permease
VDNMTDYQPSITQVVKNWSFAPALRSRNFRLLWVGQIVSTMGTFLQVVAENWLLYNITGSTFLLGVVGFIGLLPVVPISFLGGVVIDRVPRRKLITFTQIGLLMQAAVFGLLASSGQIRVWHIVALDFVMGSLYAIDTPARQAFLTELVSKEDLANAVALNSAIFQLSRVVGQAIAGLLIAGIGAGGAMLLNAASYLAPVAALAMMRVQQVDRAPEQGPLVAAVSEGMATLLRRFALVGTVSLMMTAGALPHAVLFMMPAFAEDVLGTDAIGLGLLLSSSATGAVIGALMARLGTSRRGRTLTGSSFLLPLLVVGFAAARKLPLACLILLGIGLVQCVLQAMAATLVQINVPDRVRGRVMSLYMMLIVGAPKLGGVLLGGIAEPLGLPPATILCSVVVFVYVIGVYVFAPAVRQLD